jgi:two-component system, cell cycle response regulator DivK
MDSDSQSRERRRRPYPGRVLLVSASESDRDTYADYLRAEGLCVIYSDTAAAAYAMASSVRLCAVVTEVRLHGPDDGFTLTRRLKTHPTLRQVPVLILSGFVFGSVREAARSAGCDGFLLKPCSSENFTGTLRALSSGVVLKRSNIAAS